MRVTCARAWLDSWLGCCSVRNCSHLVSARVRARFRVRVRARVRVKVRVWVRVRVAAGVRVRAVERHRDVVVPMEEDHGRLAQGEPQRVHQLKDLGVDEKRDEEADPAGAVACGVAADRGGEAALGHAELAEE